MPKAELRADPKRSAQDIRPRARAALIAMENARKGQNAEGTSVSARTMNRRNTR